MKSAIGAMLFVILLGLLPAAYAGGQASESGSPPQRGALKPVIFVETPVHDFGFIEPSKKVSHVFKIENRGTAPLMITNVFSDCDCAVGKMRSGAIAPSEVGELDVVFDAPRYKDKPGIKVRHLIVSSNDPDRPEIELTVRAKINFTLTAAPDILYFEEVHRGQAQTKPLFLFEGKGVEARVVNVTSDLNFISVSAPTSVRGSQRGYRFDVAIGKGAPVGLFKGMITIVTDHRQRPEIKVPVAGSVLGQIRVNPQHFSFGLVRAGESKSKTIEVARVDEENFEITDIEFAANFVTLEKTVRENGKKYQITVSLKPTVPRGRYHEQLKIHTNDPEESVIVVPYYAVVWSRK